ncbi:MAG: heme-binding protein [Pseudomonadota bacterium]
MNKLLIGALCLMGIAATSVSAETYKGYEMPPFIVVSQGEEYELRDYQPHTLATVTLSGSVQQTASRGFRALAGYIFGGNDAGQKIAMTVPVQQTPDGQGHSVSFMMPGRYALETLPKPEASNITFERTEAERRAVVTFSGYATGTVLRRRAAQLRDHLARDGLTVLSGPHYAYYDDPFTLPWKRRNEVAFKVVPN